MMAKRGWSLPKTLSNHNQGLTDCRTTVTGIGWRVRLKRGSVRYIVTRTINFSKSLEPIKTIAKGADKVKRVEVLEDVRGWHRSVDTEGVARRCKATTKQ